MRCFVEFEDGQGSSRATCSGVLPKEVLSKFNKIICLQVRSGYTSKYTNREELDIELENSDHARAIFLAKILSKVWGAELDADRPFTLTQNPVPVGIRVKYKDGKWGILYLPPNYWDWDWTRRELKTDLLELDWDHTMDLKSACEYTSEDNQARKQVISNLISDFTVFDWMNNQAKQISGYNEENESFKGVDLGRNATGHRILCERLEAEGYMFIFESPFILPGDTLSGYNKRRMDLLVFRNQTALIIEIDGSQHNQHKQRGDDYERDSLIGIHWLKMRRFRNSDIINNLDGVMKVIRLLLDSKTNTSAY